MAEAGRAFMFCFIGQLLVHVSGSNVIQCLQGIDKNRMAISCTEAVTPYIEIINVKLGAVLLTSSCDAIAKKEQCCSTNNSCEYVSDETLFNEIDNACSGKSQCWKSLWSGSSSRRHCNSSLYQNVATYMDVEFECVKTISRTTTPTFDRSTLGDYSNHLTMGEQAAIICCIMIFLFLIATAVVIYKRIKYGPPEDVRKLFSRPNPNPEAGSPGVTAWLPGEAQEQVYKTLAENEKKKKKRKFPKFKF